MYCEMKSFISKLFVAASENTLLQLFRYTIVGGFAFVVDFGLLYILTEFGGFHYLLSATISFVAGLVMNYVLSKLWVFTHSLYTNKRVEFLLFAAIGVVGLMINNVSMWLLSDVIGLWYMLSKAITTVVTYLWNFFARKLMLFKKR